VRTADLSLTPIYGVRRSYTGTLAAMVIEPRKWFVRDPDSARVVELGGYLYVATDRDVEGYGPVQAYQPASGIPVLTHRDAGITTEDARQLIAATEALRAVWSDPITAGDIRRAITGAVGESAARALWVEMVRPQHITGPHVRAENVRPPAPTVTLES
jgi:hypothetical protein